MGPKSRRPPIRREYKSLSKDALRQELRARGIKSTGKKSDMVKRLEKWDHERMAAVADASDAGLTMRQRKISDSGGLATNGGLSAFSANSSAGEGGAFAGCTKIEMLNDCVDRKSLVLWRRPVMTVRYFVSELLVLTWEMGFRLWRNRRHVVAALLALLLCTLAYCFEGSHQRVLGFILRHALGCLYPVGGMSTIGGRHHLIHGNISPLKKPSCFHSPNRIGGCRGRVDLLGRGVPFPVSCLLVTLCGASVPEETGSPATGEVPSLKKSCKVCMQALPFLLWVFFSILRGRRPPAYPGAQSRVDAGARSERETQARRTVSRGTSVGPSVLDYNILAIQADSDATLPLLCSVSCFFFFFLLLRKLSGMILTIPTFFLSAELIKQMLDVCYVLDKLSVVVQQSQRCSEHFLVFRRLRLYIPYVGKYLQAPFKEFLAKQKAKLHRKVGTEVPQEGSLLSWLFEKLVMAMVVYFVLSIINSMAQNYHRRLSKGQRGPKGTAVISKVAIS
ncbi:unnamed protein product [Ixodes hexagonus]